MEKADRLKQIKPVVAGIFLMVALLGGLSWGIHTALHNNVLGPDIHVFWLSGRGLFVDHQSPYSQEFVKQSQIGVYGRLALPDEDQYAFSYPPYSLLPIFPLAYLSFDWAQALWLAFNMLAVVSAILFLFPTTRRVISFSLLAFYPVLFGLLMGCYTILLGIAVLIFYRVLAAEKTPGRLVQVLCGLFLAWTTIKPQFIWLYLVLFLMAALKRRMWVFIGSFMVGVVFYLLFSFVLLPHWAEEWINRIFFYANSNQGGTPTITRLLGSLLPITNLSYLTGLAVGLCFIGIIALFVRYWKGRVALLPILACCGWVIYATHPHSFIAYEQLIFIIPAFVWACEEEWNWNRKRWIFWVSFIICSWVSLLVKWLPLPYALIEAEFLMYSFWLGWFLLKGMANYQLGHPFDYRALITSKGGKSRG